MTAEKLKPLIEEEKSPLKVPALIRPKPKKRLTDEAKVRYLKDIIIKTYTDK